MLAFVEGELAGDPTNWWIPNPACCRTLLRHAGFGIESELDEEVYVCRRDPDREVATDRYRSEFEAATGGGDG